MKNKRINRICWILTPILFLTLSIYSKVSNIPSTIFIREGQKLETNSLIKVIENKNIRNENKVFNDQSRQKNKNLNIKSKKANVSLFGMFPIKSVFIESVSPKVTVYPGGQPIGVKLNTKGVLIIGLSDIQGEKGKVQSPGGKLGLQIGDSIIKVNNKVISNCEQLSKIINNSKGKKLKITIIRKNKIMEKIIEPIKTKSDNRYKIGVWVRDSTAGVGTLTFYNDNNKNFAALGHPITDIDTGTVLDINSGEIVSSSIIDVKKGVKGEPGELKGVFLNENLILGKIFKNTQCGIFGKGNLKITNKYNKPMEIGLRNEIKEGPAKILTTIDGEQPKLYDIQIDKLLKQESPGPKSMIIKVTDKELLNKTGGIVQGMSGSPIIQNNRLVGAVTHVLINKPDTGYGIYIEWMLRESNDTTK